MVCDAKEMDRKAKWLEIAGSAKWREEKDHTKWREHINMSTTYRTTIHPHDSMIVLLLLLLIDVKVTAFTTTPLSFQSTIPSISRELRLFL